MVQKRLFEEEEFYDVCYKHPRQVEQCLRLVSFSESVYPEAKPRVPHSSGEVRFSRSNTEGDEKHGSVILAKPPTNPEYIEDCSKYDEKLGCDFVTKTTHDGYIEACAPESNSVSFWATSSTCKDVVRSEAPLHASLFPEYLSPECPSRRLGHSEDIYSLLLECSPRKPVPVGPIYQVHIPEWDPHGLRNTSSHLGVSAEVPHSELINGVTDENKLIGTCVIPMPNLELPADGDDKVGNGRTDCNCEDAGSVRCVKQHILEARERIRRNIGQEKFVELGFYDMGDQVAEKWSEDEEQLFHDVVYSNPASSRKNFWEILFTVFPSRTKKDIVSYYFNVFMLQRRAVQNRCDPFHIDSDNDEEQLSDEYGDDELGLTDEYEDSVVESPVYADDLADQSQEEEDDDNEYDGDVADENCDSKPVDCSGPNGNDNMSETCFWNLRSNCDSDPTLQLEDKISWDKQSQEDSSTSSDAGGPALQVTQVKASHGNHWPDSFNGLSSDGGHGYVLDHCDAKVWDTAYMSCPKNAFDFLPTCNMIEEVFGDE